MSLFRPASIDAQRRRLHGAVMLRQPVRLAVFSAAAVLVTAAGVSFLALGHYARKETVTGWLAPEAGLAAVHAVRGGAAETVLVRQGDLVEAGQPLIRMALDQAGADGAVAPQQRAAMRARLAELDVQGAASAARHADEAQRLADRSEVASRDAARLAASRPGLVAQLTLAERAEQQGRDLAARGFMAQPEVDRRSGAVIAARLQLESLDREIAARQAEARDLAAQRAALGPLQAGEASQLRAARTQIEATLAELSIQDGYVLRAPIAGRVAAVSIRPGETAPAGAPVVAVAPEGSALEARLLAPTRAGGFLGEGQAVRLMVDAFPFQQFGAIRGEIVEVSRIALSPRDVSAPVEVREPVFALRVRLEGQGVAAYGEMRALQPGMTVRADVITARRSFLQWLTDPLLAARARAEA
jgi:membrane fusion protein